MIKVQVTDTGVIEAFNRLIAFGESPQPALKAIGEKMLEFTKARFVSGTDPYGNTWAPNADTTLRNALHRGSKNFTKNGGLSKKGQTFLAGKKPLIGESKSLSTQIHSTVIGDDMVTVSSTMTYAATQQFGAKQGEFGRDKRNHPIPWGDIPARPFFPDPARGLPEQLQQDIMGVLRIALQNARDGK
jgi:phage gpG-like protein